MYYHSSFVAENKTSDASKFEIRAVLKGSAAIEINNEHGLMKCCSNGEKPPLMKILFCNNPPECDIIKSTAALGKFSASTRRRICHLHEVCTKIVNLYKSLYSDGGSLNTSKTVLNKGSTHGHLSG